MKTIIATLLLMFAGITAFSDDGPLLPDGINQILGRIRPHMTEADLGQLAKRFYPEATMQPDVWSGQTGYVKITIDSRYSISVSEYNDPKDFNKRFVHADMYIYVYDWQTKTRVNLSLYKWDTGGEKKEQQITEPAGGAYVSPAAGAPSAHP
jgi:hypothetical protein